MINKVTLGDKEIILVGTAHVSKDSVDEVIKTIADEQPDAVAIELCPSRFKQLENIDRWKDLDIVKVIKSGNAFLLLMNLLLSSYQRKIGEELGIRPGQEMISAIGKAREVGAENILIDRDMNITLKRVWNGMSFFEKMKLFSELLSSFSSKSEEVSEKQIEEMKKNDIITMMMDELGERYPSIRERLITERDRFMAQKLRDAGHKKIVAVVGAGHMQGILKHLHVENNLEELNKIEKKSGFILPLLKWGIPLAILGMFVAAFFLGGTELSLKVLAAWLVANSIPSAIGCAISGGGFFAILAAFISAPFTSLNPLISAGILAGLTEAYFKKPKVADIEELPSLEISFKTLRKNRITRIILILILTNLGSFIGSIYGSGWIASYLNL